MGRIEAAIGNGIPIRIEEETGDVTAVTADKQLALWAECQTDRAIIQGYGPIADRIPVRIKPVAEYAASQVRNEKLARSAESHAM